MDLEGFAKIGQKLLGFTSVCGALVALMITIHHSFIFDMASSRAQNLFYCYCLSFSKLDTAAFGPDDSLVPDWALAMQSNKE